MVHSLKTMADTKILFITKIEVHNIFYNIDHIMFSTKIRISSVIVE